MLQRRTALKMGAALAVTGLTLRGGRQVFAETGKKPVTLRVYHIGNSVTDTIHYHGLEALAKARGNTYTFGRHMIPGAPLAWIYQHPDSGFQEEPYGYYPKALSDFSWDVLTLQPFDRQLEEGDESDLLMARHYIDLARNKSPDLQVYIYQRWPRRDEPEKGKYRLDYRAKYLRTYTGGWDGTNETRDYFTRLTLALRKAYPDLKKPVLLVPVGDVLLALDEKMRAGKAPGYPDISAVYADGIHFNEAGRYVVGCTFYVTLFQDDPRGLPSTPYNVTDAALARTIQETVWEVVREHPLARNTFAVRR